MLGNRRRDAGQVKLTLVGLNRSKHGFIIRPTYVHFHLTLTSCYICCEMLTGRRALQDCNFIKAAARAEAWRANSNKTCAVVGRSLPDEVAQMHFSPRFNLLKERASVERGR